MFKNKNVIIMEKVLENKGANVFHIYMYICVSMCIFVMRYTQQKLEYIGPQQRRSRRNISELF